MLFRSQREILVPAKDLQDHDGIATDEAVKGVEYWHFLLDQHAVVFSEGAPTESLLIGEQSIASMVPEAVEEVRQLFPDLDGFAHRLVRDEIRGHRARSLVRRTISNGKRFLDSHTAKICDVKLSRRQPENKIGSYSENRHDQGRPEL